MWEVIATSLITHLGKKAIDRFWSGRHAGEYPVLNQAGTLRYATLDTGRVSIGRSATVPNDQEYETLFGDFYIPDTIADIITGDEIALVLVIEEHYQQVLLFEADLDTGYQIDLPHGVYSVCVFLVDGDADDLFDAMIYAVGFQCAEHIDLSDISTITVSDHEDIWDMLDDSPIEMTWHGPFYLDFILIDTEQIPEFPLFFSEFF